MCSWRFISKSRSLSEKSYCKYWKKMEPIIPKNIYPMIISNKFEALSMFLIKHFFRSRLWMQERTKLDPKRKTLVNTRSTSFWFSFPRAYCAFYSLIYQRIFWRIVSKKDAESYLAKTYKPKINGCFLFKFAFLGKFLAYNRIVRDWWWWWWWWWILTDIQIRRFRKVLEGSRRF